ncbi:hypothetical protein ACWJJH_20810 [Endozoicomonadaceae bacterium StTr2]
METSAKFKLEPEVKKQLEQHIREVNALAALFDSGETITASRSIGVKLEPGVEPATVLGLLSKADIAHEKLKSVMPEEQQLQDKFDQAIAQLEQKGSKEPSLEQLFAQQFPEAAEKTKAYIESFQKLYKTLYPRAGEAKKRRKLPKGKSGHLRL